MARRTKAEAQATRGRILDAAEQLFQQQGVARTSLQDIAQAAGVTRGAVYWHFRGKADLFNAMIDRVQASLAAPLDGPQPECPTLPDLARDLLTWLRRVATDEHIRRVYEIATQKVEYVDDLAAVRQRHRAAVRARRAAIEACLRRAGLPARAAAGHALALHALMVGLIHSWLLDPDSFDLPAQGARALSTYLAALPVPSTGGAGRGSISP